MSENGLANSYHIMSVEEDQEFVFKHAQLT